uniref:Metalloendopeptidase n=1 Tax=Electrophorus electricus TaxID=8005 RepID=A0A4W4FST2_ELEEL
MCAELCSVCETGGSRQFWNKGLLLYWCVVARRTLSNCCSVYKHGISHHWFNGFCSPIIRLDCVALCSTPCRCCSYVGRRGCGPQAISIGKSCDKFGIVVRRVNFLKMELGEVNSLDEEYDYNSIMHYTRNAFSRDIFFDTILPRYDVSGARPPIGQRMRLSKGDIAPAQKLYKCPMGAPGNSRPVSLLSCVPEIVLNFQSIDLYRSHLCWYDRVEVRNGYWWKFPLMRVVLSPAICGGEIHRDCGQIQSSNYPGDYCPNKVCVWKVTVALGFHVGLRFQSFGVRGSLSPLLDRFCGNQIPDNIEASSSQLWLLFMSDGSVNKEQIAANFFTGKGTARCSRPDEGQCEQRCVNILGSYRFVCEPGYELAPDHCEAACGGFITKLNGSFSSPGEVCMTSLPGVFQVCMTSLPGVFQVCKYDFLEVHSGPSSGLRLQGRFCGSSKPEAVTSFFTLFFSDVDECSQDNGRCQQDCVNTFGSYTCQCVVLLGCCLSVFMFQAGCDQVITTVSGTITSPNWPNKYPVRSPAPEPSQPHLDTATNWYLHHQHAVKLHLCTDTIYGQCLVQCACPPLPVLSNGDQMFLCFFSNSSVQRRDFEVYYAAGDVSSQAPKGYGVELEKEEGCGYDHVELFDGADAEAPFLGRDCGSGPSEKIHSAGDAITIRFYSDDTISKKGFHVRYTSTRHQDLLHTSD